MSMNPWWQMIGAILFALILFAPAYLLLPEQPEEGGDEDDANGGQK